MRMISALKFSSYQRRVYTLALILGLFIFVLPSCTEEVVPSQSIEIKKAGFEKFSIEDLPAMANAIAPFVNPNFEQKVDGKLTVSPQNESELSKALNYDEVLARYDGKGNTNYAMAVADNDDNPFSFSNFIIMKDSSGAFRTPFVLTYEMADDFIEEYLVDKDISKFRGKITKYILGPMDAQRVVSRNPNTNDPEPGSGGNTGTPPTQDGNVVCETVSSGGTAPVPVDTGGGGGWYQVCEITLHTVYDYDMTNDGQNSVWLSWITYDNCQIVFLNQFAVAGSSTCPSGTGDGEIPLIEPDFSIIFSTSFLQNQKALCVYTKLSSSNIMAKYLQRFDSEFAIKDLKWDVVTTLADHVNAMTYANFNEYYKIDINSNNLINHTNLEVAKTMMHELIHAELARKVQSVGGSVDPSNFPGIYDYYRRFVKNWEHQQMAAHFTGIIGKALWEFDGKSKDLQYYEDLSWAGLWKVIDKNNPGTTSNPNFVETAAWQSLTTQEKNRIAANINSEKINGTKTCIG